MAKNEGSAMAKMLKWGKMGVNSNPWGCKKGVKMGVLGSFWGHFWVISRHTPIFSCFFGVAGA